jgi:protein-disulfide isomerase
MTSDFRPKPSLKTKKIMSIPQDEITLEEGAGLDLAALLLPIQPEDHVQGLADAPLTLVEYGDYECPACGSLFLTISRLLDQQAGQVRIVFRHYPLSGLHPYAQLAAEAAEASGAQGKFWEMHDLLFQYQDALDEKHLIGYAERLALDADRFRKDLKDRTFEQRVREDFRRGVANGVYGTPGLFVNGVRHDGALDAPSILTKLD